MRKYEFWIFLAIAFVLIWFSISTASASILGQFSDYSLLSNSTLNWNTRLHYYRLNEADKAIFATLENADNLHFRWIANENNLRCYWVLVDATGWVYTSGGSSNPDCSGSGIGTRTITDIGGGLYKYDLTMDSTYANNYILNHLENFGGFAIGNNGTGKVAGTAYTTYASSTWFNSNFGFNQNYCYVDCWADATIWNGWFQIEGNFVSPYSIDWIFPTDNATTTDFGFWRVNIKSEADFYIQVHYYTDDYSQEYVDTGGLYMDTGGSAVEKAVLKENVLSYGDWNAEAFLISDDYLITYAQTDVIDFEIIATSTAISYPTASSTCANLGWVGEPMCNLAFLLIIPKQSTFNNFINLKTQLENKPPFGYATAVYEAFGGFSEATATTTINLSIFEQNIPNYINPIKNALSIIIWLGFGFWIFSRVRHFEF